MKVGFDERTGYTFAVTRVPAPPPGSTYQAVVNWGDETSSPGTLSAVGGQVTITGTHAYETAGRFAQNAIVSRWVNGLPVEEAFPLGPHVEVADARIDPGKYEPISVLAGEESYVTVVRCIDANKFEGSGIFTAKIHWGDADR